MMGGSISKYLRTFLYLLVISTLIKLLGFLINLKFIMTFEGQANGLSPFLFHLILWFGGVLSLSIRLS